MVTTRALRKRSKIQVLQSVTTFLPGQETRLSTISRWRVVIPKVYWTQRSKMTQKIWFMTTTIPHYQRQSVRQEASKLE